jgi:protoporphyrinogen oxidase
MFDEQSRCVVIGGGGPAGLTAAYQLAKTGIPAIVLEKDGVVGGIARTVNYKGYRFDVGGHRFFTKSSAVEQMWHEVLTSSEFLRRNRLSRIYYRGRFFDYPLRPANALFSLGVWNSALVVGSYCWARLHPVRPEFTFEAWVSNRFGRRLYEIFFKTYTEKVWGIPCTELSAEWAAQRIKGLSLAQAVRNAFGLGKARGEDAVIRTLIDSFEYPKHGPGMMWERVSELVRQMGGEIRLGEMVARIHWQSSRVIGFETAGGQRVEGSHFISSMPIRELIASMDPAVPRRVREASERLKYRDFLTVALIVNQRDTFPDNWIYVHEPNVKVGRIQNFKNWSPAMVPDPDKTCIGLEYFCFEGDGLWAMRDAQLVELARREINSLGLVRAEDIVDGAVVRMPKAYPVYDSEYQQALAVVRAFLKDLPNLQLVGRNGMHKYNNQDHSMLTAMLAVKNILGASHDLWQVNADAEYLEHITPDDVNLARELAEAAATQPEAPVPKKATAGRQVLPSDIS